MGTVIDSPLESSTYVPDVLAEKAMERLAGRRAFVSPRSNLLVGDTELIVSIGGPASTPTLIVHTPDDLSAATTAGIVNLLTAALAELEISLTDPDRCVRQIRELEDRERAVRETEANMVTVMADVAAACTAKAETEVADRLEVSERERDTATAAQHAAEAALAVARLDLEAAQNRAAQPDDQAVTAPVAAPIAGADPFQRAILSLLAGKKDFIAGGSRPDLIEYGLMLAQAVSLRADCTRRQVGAVIVDEHRRIIGTGYNGAPSGQPGCLSASACPRGQKSYSDIPAGAPYVGAGVASKCIALHAEENALLHSDATARRGATIYITDEPCDGCSRLLNGSGLAKAVWPVIDGDTVTYRSRDLPHFGASYGEEPVPVFPAPMPAPSTLAPPLDRDSPKAS